MYDSLKLNCPDCRERITIYPSNQACSECGADIKKLKVEQAEKVHETKEKIQQVVVESPLKLRSIRVQESVIRVNIEGEENFRGENPDSETVMEMQQKLSELTQNIKRVDGVNGFEKWVGGVSSNVGSKYGMNPKVKHKNKNEVVLLIGYDSF